jgi:hypothetical protein
VPNPPRGGAAGLCLSAIGYSRSYSRLLFGPPGVDFKAGTQPRRGSQSDFGAADGYRLGRVGRNSPANGAIFKQSRLPDCELGPALRLFP